jgi:hypothetical protein
MAWYIASIPFWLSGFWFFPIATIAIFVKRKPYETDSDLAIQTFTSVLLGGLLLVIAAKLCS